MPRPTSGSAPSSEWHLTLTGGRSWTMGVKGSAHTARTCSRRAPTATRTKPRHRSSIRWTPFTITATSHEPGQPSSSTTRTVSLKRTWSASVTAYGRMFGSSWGRKPKRTRIFSRPGRGSTLKSSSWPTSKTPLPRPSTSFRALPDIKKNSSMHPLLWITSLG